jgi:hypothetical protein
MPSSSAAFPATRTPFPGGDLYRVPEAPAAWKIQVQKRTPSHPKSNSKDNTLRSADIFLGKSQAREALVLGSGESLEKWRIGEDLIQYAPAEDLAIKEATAAEETPDVKGDPLSVLNGWSSFEELQWLTKESFWFQYNGPTGSLLIFVEDEEAFLPESAVPPDATTSVPSPYQAAAALNPCVAAPSSPAGTPAGNTPVVEFNPVAAARDPKIIIPEGNAPDADPQPFAEKPSTGGKILAAAPKAPMGLIPGVALKPSVRAVAIDAQTRLPRYAQFGTTTLAYTFTSNAPPPQIPSKVSALVRRVPARPVNPAVSSVPTP